MLINNMLTCRYVMEVEWKQRQPRVTGLASNHPASQDPEAAASTLNRVGSINLPCVTKRCVETILFDPIPSSKNQLKSSLDHVVNWYHYLFAVYLPSNNSNMNISVSACNVLLMRTTKLCKSSTLYVKDDKVFSFLYFLCFTNLYATVNLRSCVYMYVDRNTFSCVN